MKKFLWVMVITAIASTTLIFIEPLLSGIAFTTGVFMGGASLAVFEFIDRITF